MIFLLIFKIYREYVTFTEININNNNNDDDEAFAKIQAMLIGNQNDTYCSFLVIVRKQQFRQSPMLSNISEKILFFTDNDSSWPLQYL